MSTDPSSLRAVLPKPCDSLEYAKGCDCEKCSRHQAARDRQYREERIQEFNRGTR